MYIIVASIDDTGVSWLLPISSNVRITVDWVSLDKILNNQDQLQHVHCLQRLSKYSLYPPIGISYKSLTDIVLIWTSKIKNTTREILCQ